MLLGALQSRPQLRSEAELEEEARQLSAKAKTQAMKGGLCGTPAAAMARQRCYELHARLRRGQTFVTESCFRRLPDRVRLCRAGHWEFEQRLRDTVLAEDAVLAQGRAAKHEAQQRLVREQEARQAKRAEAVRAARMCCSHRACANFRFAESGAHALQQQ